MRVKDIRRVNRGLARFSPLGRFGQVLNVNNTSSPADTEGVLFGANHFDRLHNAVTASGATETSFATRMQVKIGSGSRKGLRFIFENYYLDASGEHNTGNSVVIDSVYLERGATAIPVLFGGSASTTMSSGDVDKISDRIKASQFGLSNFALDDSLWLRISAHLTGSGNIPVSRGTAEKAGSQSVKYASGSTTLDNISGTGSLSFTGTTPTAMTFAYTALCIGDFASAPLDVFSYCADSHGEGHVTAVNPSYVYDGLPGYIMNSLADTSGANVYAMIQVGFGGTGPADFIGSNTKWQSLLKYTSSFVFANGGNPGSITDFTTLLNIAKGVSSVTKFIAFPTFPQASSTDSYATTANQTAYTGYNNNIPAQNTLTSGWNDSRTIDYYCYGYGGLANDDTTKWVNDGSTAYYAVVNDSSAAPIPPLHMTTTLNSATGVVTASARETFRAAVANGPALYSGSVGSITNTTSILTISTTKSTGTIYSVVVPQASGATPQRPSNAQIKAGQQSDSSAATATQTKAVTATGSQTLSFTGLTQATSYDIWSFHEFTSGNSESFKSNFTTIANIGRGFAWVENAGTGATVVLPAFSGTAAAGDLLVCFGTVVINTKTLGTPTDNTASGTWTGASFNPYSGTIRMYMWWKVCVGGETTITITPSASGTNTLVHAGHYTKQSGTWTPEGTWITNATVSTNPTPGTDITPTSSVSAVVFGHVFNTLQTPTVGANYTLQKQATHTQTASSEDRIINSTSGGYRPIWTCASDTWATVSAIISAK